MITLKEEDLRALIKDAWDSGFYANRNAGDIEDYEDSKHQFVTTIMLKAGKLNGSF
jgi:hypothetical protein